MDKASIGHRAIEGKHGEEVRYGIENDSLPEESFYLICAYRYVHGECVSRRVLGKSASSRAAERDVLDLRAGRVPTGIILEAA